ncbi:MAG: cytochrome c3 family protein [Desulfobulbales bacterium]|nr:cytochrome c3 family protein [Desulfobulbales bacterium]
MRITGKHKNALSRFFIAAAILLAAPALVQARVSGPCYACHTMHNSQGGTAQVIVDPTSPTNVGWTAGGIIGGSAEVNSPQQYLLKTNCVGCHSATGTTARTINIAGIAGSQAPIVWNIGDTANPTLDLAGGNFSYVAADQTKGHNVLGISGTDSNLPIAPGVSSGKGCAKSCHQSLAIVITDPNAIPESGVSENGCEGCHLHVGHHDPMVAGGTGPGNAYRFLGGHGGVSGFNAIVDNWDGDLEGPGWQWGGADTNVYIGQGTLAEVQSPSELVIGRFCAGCHHKFHAAGGIDEMLGEDNKGSRRDSAAAEAIPWLRHPTNVNIGGFVASEFDGLIGLPYADGLPLARAGALLTGYLGTIEAADQVMCLSCHKAHGSEFPDALRWDYTATIAHSGLGDTTTGCFYCHRTKDLT